MRLVTATGTEKISTNGTARNATAVKEAPGDPGGNFANN